jgi:hypothetical protein
MGCESRSNEQLLALDSACCCFHGNCSLMLFTSPVCSFCSNDCILSYFRIAESSHNKNSEKQAAGAVI